MDYVAVEDARAAAGLRMVVTAGAPGPWSEAAKAILRVKGLAFLPVAHRGGMDDPELVSWTGQSSAPVAMLEDERPRGHWSEILLLAERLAPDPRLVPEDESVRAEMFGVAHEICGEDGLGWNRRLLMFDRLEESARRRTGAGPDASPNPAIASMRFRYSANGGAERAQQRLVAILGHLAARLRRQNSKGSAWLVGDALTAVDLYWSAFANLFAPMPDEQCPMPAYYRDNACDLPPDIAAALDPPLLARRDRIAALCFTLPMDF